MTSQILGKRSFLIYMQYISKCHPSQALRYISKFFSTVLLYDRRLKSWRKRVHLDLIFFTFLAVNQKPSVENVPNFRQLSAWRRYTTYIEMEFFQ